MSHLTTALVTWDGKFREIMTVLLQKSPVPVALVDSHQIETLPPTLDLVIVDVRMEPDGGNPTIETLRGRMPSASITCHSRVISFAFGEYVFCILSLLTTRQSGACCRSCR